MSDIIHRINGQNKGVPRNWQDIEITIDWLDEINEASINITDLAFVLKAKDYLNERIMNGLNGGVGVFEGEPYSIEIKDNGADNFKFEGYLDFSDKAITIGSEELVVSLKKKKGSDWLNDVADGFSFAYLADQGIINQADYVKVPYVINYVPDGTQLLLLSISAYMMAKELAENISELAEAIGNITNASTPVLGTSVGAGAGVVTAWDLGDYIQAGLKVAARLAYIIAVIIAIKQLIEEIFEQLLPRKREHLGITYTTLFVRGCQYLGLEFESSISDLNNVYIPQKDKKGGEAGEVGYPGNTDPIYTFGDLIRVLKDKFNADYRIINGVLHFERKDKFKIASTYKIPSFFNDQDRLLDRFQLNTNEMVSNYNINWRYDTQDQNTLDDQTGRVFQAITTPISVENKDFVTIKNLSQISVPFALGKTKLGLTDVEKKLKELGKVVDKLTSALGNGTNYASKIDARIGTLLLSSHFITVPKTIVMQGNILANDQRGLLSAKHLWDNYHFINSFAEVNGVHNQYFRFSEQPIPMKLKEFNLILENNIIEDDKGNVIEIENVVWKPESETALISYRQKKKYTNNLKIDYIV